MSHYADISGVVLNRNILTLILAGVYILHGAQPLGALQAATMVRCLRRNGNKVRVEVRGGQVTASY